MKNLKKAVLMSLAMSLSFAVHAKPAEKTTKTKNTAKPVAAKTLKVIEARANEVVKFHKKASPEFGKNEASVQALDQAVQLYLAKPRNAKQNAGFIQSYGAFYGQTLVSLFGGKWVYWNGGIALKHNNGLVAYPYASIKNRLTNNKPGSIYHEMLTYKKLSAMSKMDVDKFVKKAQSSKGKNTQKN